MKNGFFKTGWLICLLVTMVTKVWAAPLRQDSVVLSFSIPQYMAHVITNTMLDQFETAHPGIKVKVTYANLPLETAALNLESHLSKIRSYVSSADVLFANSWVLSAEATVSGYFLNLEPLVAADTTLTASDFVPQVWESFRWNNGMWALPSSISIFLLIYYPDAFDKAQLDYPSEHWSMEQFAGAIRKLAAANPAGKGIYLYPGYGDLVLLRSLLGSDLLDSSVSPDSPLFTIPALGRLLSFWSELQQAGLVGKATYSTPMSISPISYLYRQDDSQDKRVGSLLPGGKAGLWTQGFAVSAGTQHPYEAYALARFLATRPEIATLIPHDVPAFNEIAISPRPTPNEQALINQALENGLRPVDMRYTDYLTLALNDIASGKTVQEILPTIQDQAEQNQQLAMAEKKITPVVATPLPTAIQQVAKNSLKFGITGTLGVPLFNQAQWTRVTADFVAQDESVGQIILDTVEGNNIGIALKQNDDCFYLTPAVLERFDGVVNLDPLMAADPSFIKSEFPPNVLSQMQSKNKTWGFPITLAPEILRYDSQQFQRANLSFPNNDWTANTFANDLAVLKTSDHAPFVTTTANGTYLLMLIAAYDGLPIDYRTTPPTLHFSDPATVSAIRQTLDLARSGYFAYGKLGIPPTNTGGEPVPVPDPIQQEAAIYTDSFTLNTYRTFTAGLQDNRYRPVSYPKGRQFTPAMFNIGAVFISARAADPQACYRWIRTIANHPELFPAMPARAELLGNLALRATQGDDLVNLYGALMPSITAPNSVAFPSLSSGMDVEVRAWLEYWLYRAFDAYVTEGADLETNLVEAENYTKAYLDCLSAGTMTTLSCAITADPRIHSRK